MSRKEHASETPATQLLKRRAVVYTEHLYDYVENGGTAESARQLGVDEHHVVKTLVMEDDRAQPLVVLMHGDLQVSTKNLARQIGVKKVQNCKPEVAQRVSGRWHLAVRHEEGDAHLRGSHGAGVAAHLHQRRAAWLPGEH